MTRFRMVSRCGEGLAWLARIQAEGYECDFWIPPSVPPDLYEEMIPRIDEWRDGLDDDVIVLFDAVGSGRLADEVPQSWGAGTLNDVLQFDRAFGLKIARIHGVKVPAWARFSDTGSAIEYLQEHPDTRWDLELPNGQLFYENRSAEQMAELLELTEPLTDFYLLARTEGAALTLAGWYVGGELVPNSLLSTVEPRRFLAGDYGPACQPPLCLAWFWPPKKKREGETTPTLYRHTLRKLEPFLRQHRYGGPLALRLVVGKADGIPALSAFETGCRYPALYAMLEGLQPQGSIAEVLSTMAQGNVPTLQPSFEWLGAMAISVPPYPYGPGRANHLVRGELDGPHCWPLDLKNIAGQHFTAGAHGVLAHVTARAGDRKDLSNELVRLTETLDVADKQLRRDGLDAEATIALLKDWHYF